MNPAAGVDWTALHRAASAPYRAAGRFAWHFARGKLGRDPVFRFLVERGLFEVEGRGGAGAPLRVLDVGCGQGLVASLLGSAVGPRGAVRYTGIDLMPRDIERARSALGDGRATRFICADMRDAAFAPCDVAVILDVLHYVDPDAQRRVVERVRDALGAESGRGRLLLRVGDQAAGRGFAVSQWVDRAVTRCRGHRVAPTWGRPLAAWRELLAGAGFRVVDAVPMSRGTPFANVLLVADLGGAGADA